MQKNGKNGLNMELTLIVKFFHEQLFALLHMFSYDFKKNLQFFYYA